MFFMYKYYLQFNVLQIFSLDIDECDSDSYCACSNKEACINIKGSCECRCPEGYVLLRETDCVGK